MMFGSPFFTPPFYRRLPQSYYPPPTQYSIPSTETKIKPESPNSTSPKCDFISQNPQIFHIAGITLYFDDILIICLLFFLYSEGVKDEMLFICLILLLLS